MISVHRKCCPAVLLAVLVLLYPFIARSAKPAPSTQQAKLPANAVPGELIVKFKPGATDAEIEHGLKLGRLKAKRHLQTEAMHAKEDDGLTLTKTSDPV